MDPSFSQPYNQLGYAYRFIEKFTMRKAFKRCHGAYSGDPNPYHGVPSLMKVGRFEESIRMYGKALALDRKFVASHWGSETTIWDG